MTIKHALRGALNRILAPLGLEVYERLGLTDPFVAALRRHPDYPRFETWLDGVQRGRLPIFVRYSVTPTPRYGSGRPYHRQLEALFAAQRQSYREVLAQFVRLAEGLARIAVSKPDDVLAPWWLNRWFPVLDAVALYSFIALRKPRTYLEIGSGFSTKFARRAIADHGTRTRVISIDPQPRAEIDAISDEVIRRPLEEADLETLDTLEAGDILFFDGTHRCFMNSDVTVFFLEVLPRIAPGVLVQVHDVYLPADYPPERALQYESEQYLLAVMLLGGANDFRVVLPNSFVVIDTELCGILDPIWNAFDPPLRAEGASFWMEKIG